MIPVDHGFVCYLPSAQLHKEARAWHPGWGVTRAEAIANAHYSVEALRFGAVRTQVSKNVPKWVWQWITPTFPWDAVVLYLTSLPEGERRIGRFFYDKGHTWDIIAHLAPSMRTRAQTHNERGFLELPPYLREQALKETAPMGVLEDHLVKLQKLGEVIEGTPEERYEKFLGYCRTKDAAASLWVEATNRRRKVMDTWKSR